MKLHFNWNDFPTFLKRGSCCIKEDYFIPENELPENHRNNLSPRTLDPEEDEYGVEITLGYRQRNSNFHTEQKLC